MVSFRELDPNKRERVIMLGGRVLTAGLGAAITWAAILWALSLHP